MLHKIKKGSYSIIIKSIYLRLSDFESHTSYTLQRLVGCSLTSHSAIFHLYGDGTFVQFPNIDLLPGTQRHGHLTGTSEHAVRVCRELNPDRPIHNPLPLRHRGGPLQRGTCSTNTFRHTGNNAQEWKFVASILCPYIKTKFSISFILTTSQLERHAILVR